MKDKDNIEKLFGDKFKNAGAKPPDGVKEAIEKKLVDNGYLKNNGNSKKGLYWTFGIIAFLSVIISLAYFLNQNNGIDKNPSPQIVSNSKLTDGKSLPNDINPSKDLSNQKTANKIGILNNNQRNDDKSSSNSTQSNTDESSSNQKLVSSSNSNGLSQNNEINISSTEKLKNQNGDNHNTSSIIKDSIAEKQSNVIVSDNQITNLTNNVTKPDSVASSSNNKVIDTIKNNKDSNQIAVKDTTSITPEIPINPNSKTKHLFAIDLSIAPQISNASYSGLNSSFQSTADASKSAEKQKISFVSGLGVNMNFHNFIIEAGINYTRLTSTFSYNKTSISYDTSASHYNYIDSTYIYADNQDTSDMDTMTVHLDSNWVHKSNTITSKTPTSATNRIDIIEFPFLIGYRFSVGKFDIDIKEGVSLSLITSISTTVFSPDSNQVTVYNSMTDSPYRKTYWSFLCAANIAYNIDERFSLFLQPKMKLGLTSIYNSSYPISERLQNYSLALGLRIKL